MDELLKQLLEAELAKVQETAKKAAEPAPAEPAQATPSFDMAALVEALKPVMNQAIASAVEENVAKAMPAARAEGVGPKGEVSGAQSEANPLVDLVKKARTSAELTPAEKRAVWKLTYHTLRQGLSYDPREN